MDKSQDTVLDDQVSMTFKRSEKRICILANDFDPQAMRTHFDLQLLHFCQILFKSGYKLEIMTRRRSLHAKLEPFRHGRIHRIDHDFEAIALCDSIQPDLFILENPNQLLHRYLNAHQRPAVLIVNDKAKLDVYNELKYFWANGQGIKKWVALPGIVKHQYIAHKCFQNYHVLVQDPQLQELYCHRYNRPAFFIPSMTDCQDSIPEKQGPQKILCLVKNNDHELYMFKQLLKSLQETISDWIVLAIDLPPDQVTAWQKNRVLVLSSWDRDQIHDLFDSVDSVVSLHGFDEMFVHAWARCCKTIAYWQEGETAWHMPDFVRSVRNLRDLVHAVEDSRDDHSTNQRLTHTAKEYALARHSIQTNKQRLLSYIDGLITVYDKDF
ncbi:hypothetical protein GF406_10625 [candidate division KSB1 bacterium]|nr:hypothetical protein [candidate division KSB1 bacterium]